MAFIEATFDPNTETVMVNGQVYEQDKYWTTQFGVLDTVGLWDDENKNFIPDGFFDNKTGHITPIEWQILE